VGIANDVFIWDNQLSKKTMQAAMRQQIMNGKVKYGSESGTNTVFFSWWRAIAHTW
jgi:hypothetical protein